MGKILTITIPSYNVEQYLEQTLESFIDVSIMNDLEVLIIDDGSTDQTAAIGKRYEARYPQTFRVISKANGGHGSAINKGIEESTGWYFTVVDGDDWVRTEDFVQLVEELKCCDADYVITDYYEKDDVTGKLTLKTFPALRNGGTSPDKYLQFSDVAERVQIPIHSLVMRASILKEHKIRLDERCFYVDAEYVLYPIPYVEKMAYIPLRVYMYRLAIETQSVSVQGFQKNVQNHIDVIMHLTEFLETYRNSGGSRIKTDYISKRIVQMVDEQVRIFISFGTDNQKIKETFRQFDQKLRRASERIYIQAGKENGTLRMLRRTRFIGYQIIVGINIRRNGMEV